MLTTEDIMRNWLDKTALRWAFRLIAVTRPMFDDINDDAKLLGAQRYIDEVYTRRYPLGAVGQTPLGGRNDDY